MVLLHAKILGMQNWGGMCVCVCVNAPVSICAYVCKDPRDAELERNVCVCVCACAYTYQ